MMELLDSKYIYEFDLVSFFDNVDLDVLHKKMRIEMCLPTDFCNLIRTMNRSITKLTEKDRIPESERRIKYELDEGRIKPNPQAISHLFATEDGI